jgi:hypothetical protein
MLNMDLKVMDELVEMLDNSEMNVMEKVTLLFATAGCIIELEAPLALEPTEWAEIGYAAITRARTVRRLLDGDPEALADATIGDA